MGFVKENLNPRNRKTSDCVVRAIAKVEGKGWLEIFDALVEIGRKQFALPNSKEVYERYLKKYKTIGVMYVREDGMKKRYTIADVCKWRGTYVIAVAGHLASVVDGVLYDTWDCSHRSAYKIWRVK